MKASTVRIQCLTRHAIACAVLICAFGLAADASGVQYDFPTPWADQWQYWMNPFEGGRATGSTFGAPGNYDLTADFNDRDGIIILAWNTDAAIPTGLSPDKYRVESVHVSMSSAASMFVVPEWPIDLTVDEWFTYDINSDGLLNADGVPRGQVGDTDGESDDTDSGRPIEMFGAGFGPIYSATTWIETSTYEGAGQASMGYDPKAPRDPFPFVHQAGTNALLHVEDNVRGLHNDGLSNPVGRFTPIPWAIGEPQGYTPGSQTTPFDVEFDIDLQLSDGRVLEYFQQQISEGRIFVMVTSLKETAAFGGSPDGFAQFVMKEGLIVVPGSHAAELTLQVADRYGDYDGDWQVDAADFESFSDCVTGPGGVNAIPACAVFDFDGDDDIDHQDYATFLLEFGTM